MKKMNYKGLELTSPEEYLFSDAIPYNPEFDLEQLKQIQNKLENFTSGKSFEGITAQEAEIFLDWITFNARNYAVRHIPESAITASMTGQCAPTQRINVTTLRKMGLDIRPFNTADCIGQVPMNSTDLRRVQNGFTSPAVRHSVSLIHLPILDSYGNTQLCQFLLDPTIRQFFLKDNCTHDKFTDRTHLSKGYVAPSVGYFMKADNLRNLGVSEVTAQKTENLGKYLISKGYCYLNEENAKLYGDTFARASRRLEFQNIPIYTSGRDYLNNFENIPMHITNPIEDESQYTKLPSEMNVPKQGFLNKIKSFFQKFKRKQPIALLEAPVQEKKVEIPNILESAQLTPEQLANYRRGEAQVLSDWKNSNYSNQYVSKRRSTGEIDK